MAAGKKTGGRVAGTPNKATADVRETAQQYTAAAIDALARLGGLVDEGDGRAESEQARVSALKEILDRGHGRPAQAITGPNGAPLGAGPDLSKLTDDELAAYIALNKKLAADSGGDAGRAGTTA